METRNLGTRNKGADISLLLCFFHYDEGRPRRTWEDENNPITRSKEKGETHSLLNKCDFMFIPATYESKFFFKMFLAFPSEPMAILISHWDL